MSFKRFVAATTKDAMTQVRRELGDAVILSSRRGADGQIEILAAAAHAVEAIVEDARRSADGAVPIAPGVRRVGPAVESFHDYLRRQQRAAPAAAARYGEVAAADPELDQDEGRAADARAWPQTGGRGRDTLPGAMRATGTGGRLEAAATTRTGPTTVAGPRTATGGEASSAGRTGVHTGQMTAPAFDTWLPNAARTAAPMPAAAPPPAAGDAPAVFRRRPSRETTVVPEVGAGTAATPAAAATPVAAQAHAATTAATPAAHGAAAAAPVTAAAAPVAAPVAPALPATEIRLPAEPASAQLMAELASLRSSLQRQLTSLSSTVAAGESMRRHPAQTRVMTRLLTAGFSVEVARRFALNAPQEAEAESVDRWLHEVLAHNLRCAGQEDSLVERRAVLALVGPTGVGKTTTAAKIAARFAVRHGPGALGLITLDAYRVAAHEQLRTYGRILGAPVHLAQDAATLRELLASLQNKRLVLIDTCGLGPRDERLPEMLSMLAQAGQGRRIETLLLLNAASHAETLDDSARAWRAAQAAGALLTKVDEAARIGGALDCALRHKLKLLGLTNGQRVPEDLHQPDARLLAHLALKPAQPMFELADDEGAALALATLAARGDAHA